MRHLRFPLIAAALLATTTPTFAQPAVPFADAGVHAVQFVDETEGWAVGDDGVVWHSMDGGKTWERQKTGSRASLRGVHFTTPYTGWAVGRVESPCSAGSVGVMLRTTDGGIKWEEVGMNVLPGLNAVRFFNEKSGIVFGDGSDAFPSGMFLTNDAGKSWLPIKGPRLANVRCIDQHGSLFVGGAWGTLGRLKSEVVWTPPVKGAGPADAKPFGPFEYAVADTDPLGGRAVNGIAVGESAAFAACDGGAVLMSSEADKSWGFVNLGLPPAALAACDFKTVAAAGKHVWVAGKPGGFVLHSADSGKTWEVQKTELSVPINGMSFLNEKVGFLVGELGCIFGTTDGGKTWKAARAGGQRAAVLSLNASQRAVPLDVISTLGLGEGYICAAVALMCADSATADPKRASDAARLRNAMRLAGGATGDVGWAFPIAAHTAGLPPRELMASWDRKHDGKATEQLLRQAVCVIRMWQPEVIFGDMMVEGGSSADVLALHMAKEAFAKAADPNAFPEQITTLGLKPWAAKKLYALTQTKTGPVSLDQSIYSTALADSPKDYAEPAIRVLADDSAVVDRRNFTLVAHRLEGADKHAGLMQGIMLARGGAARRPESNVTPDIEGMEEKKKAAQSRRRLETLASAADPELAGADKVLGMLGVELKKMPDDTAARTAFAVANRLARDGKWVEAREVFGLLATNYPGHPLAIEGYRWLTRFYASSEARRRTEIQQKYLLKNVTFETIAGAGGKIVQASGTASGMAKPTVQEDIYRVYSPDAILRWHQSCLDLEPKLSAFGAVHSRDPASWLCFLAARRQVGRHNDAITFVRDYFKNSPGAATTPPGQDAWRDCLAAELWMTDRGMIAVPPKGLGYCRHTETRPLLDGKLDDACWQDMKPMPLTPLASDDAKADEKKTFASEFKTETKFAYDEAFLYVSVSCAHPAGMKVEPVSKRTRDADMTGHDRVDILLDLDRDYQTYYRFQVDHRGCLAEDCWGDKTWNPKYFAAFHSTDTGWTAEIAIPLVELTSDRPAHGRTWAANVSRVTPGKGIQSWNGPAEDTPRPEGMGLLQFRSDSK